MSVSRNLIANYLGAGWTALMTLAFIPLYVRYLGIEAFGLIGLFAMLQGWLTLLDLGMAPAMSRETALAIGNRERMATLRNLLRSLEGVAVALAFAIAAGLWLASGWLASNWLSASALDQGAIAQAFALMGGVIGLRLIENIYRSALIGMQRQVVLNVILAFAATLRGLGAVAVLAWFSPTVGAYFIWQGLVSVLSVLAFVLIVYKTLPRAEQRVHFSLHAVRNVWRFAAGAMLITCLSLLLTSVDKILLTRLLPLQAFGYYAFALAVAQALLGLVAPLAQAFYPRFTMLIAAADEASLAKAYHSAAQLVAVLLGSATAILVMFGNDILTLWTGDAALTRQTFSLIVILTLGSLLNGLMTIPYYLQLAGGWTGLMIRVNALALILVVPALLIFVRSNGAIAAAWVWLILNAVYFVTVAPLIHRRLLRSEKWKWYIDDVALPIFAAAFVAAALRLLPGAHDPLPLLLQVCISATLVTLAAALAAPTLRIGFLAWFAGDRKA